MRKEGTPLSSNRVWVKTGGEWGIVCTDADIDQHGFMTWVRNWKRQRFTRNLFNRFPDALQCDYLIKRCTRWWFIGLLCTSQPICAKRRNRFQNEAVSPFQRWTEPNRFVNAPCLRTFSKRVGFRSGLNKRHVNERRNVIEGWTLSA